MSTSLKKHSHTGTVEGVNIIPVPPFVEPIFTVAFGLPLNDTDPHDKKSLKDHKHEVVVADIPSIDLSVQQRVGNAMASHGHIQEGTGIGAGISVTVVTLTPPPL